MPLDLSPLWISLKTATLATIVTFFLGIAAAYWMLGYRGKGRSLLEGLFISPLILPPTVVGFVLLVLLGKNGPIGQLLPADVTIVFTWYAAVVTATVVAFPLMYRTALGAFEQIDVNLLHVARTLGASEWKVFWLVTLPLSLPGVLAGTTLAFARALGEFGATLMLAGDIPEQTQTMPMAIYFAVEASATNEAWFWSLVILSLSLSGIVAVNAWQAARRRRGNGAAGRWGEGNGRREAEGAEGSDQLTGSSVQASHVHSRAPDSQITGDWSKLPHTLHPTPYTPHPSSLIPHPSSLIPHPSLHVAIQKHLPGFRLNVSFQTGDRALGLLGASGAGKSMILRCLAGVETPTKGRIVLNGRVLFDAEKRLNVPARDRRIGFLVQNYALFPHMTVAQNIAFGLPKSSRRNANTIRQAVQAQLAAVQLEGLEQRYPSQLSGGQQQRVALARALASQPEALLLDEPFSALDTHLRSQLEQHMSAQLAQYPGVALFVTHNLEEAYRVCQNLLVLEQGRTIAHGTKQDIFEHPRHVSVARLTGCKNFSRAVAHGDQHIEAIDWGCTLQVVEPIPAGLTQVGIRAHQISFVEEGGGGVEGVKGIEGVKGVEEAQGAGGAGETRGEDLNSSSEPSSFSLHPSSFIPHPSSFIPHPSSFSLHPSSLPNTFPCWLTTTSETPHRMTLFLKLHAAPTHISDYHLQAEVFKEKWAVLKDQPLPWYIRLDALRLLLLEA